MDNDGAQVKQTCRQVVKSAINVVAFDLDMFSPKHVFYQVLRKQLKVFRSFNERGLTTILSLPCLSGNRILWLTNAEHYRKKSINCDWSPKNIDIEQMRSITKQLSTSDVNAKRRLIFLPSGLQNILSPSTLVNKCLRIADPILKSQMGRLYSCCPCHGWKCFVVDSVVVVIQSKHRSIVDINVNTTVQHFNLPTLYVSHPLFDFKCILSVDSRQQL